MAIRKKSKYRLLGIPRLIQGKTIYTRKTLSHFIILKVQINLILKQTSLHFHICFTFLQNYASSNQNIAAHYYIREKSAAWCFITKTGLTQPNTTQPYSTLLDSTRLNSTRLYSTRLDFHHQTTQRDTQRYSHAFCHRRSA